MPPTQPRSFTVNASPVVPSSTLPHRLPPSSTYRPGSSYVPPSIPASVRPLPSGPRALRAGLGGFGSQPGPHPQFANGRGYPPGQFAGVPRGPSVDVTVTGVGQAWHVGEGEAQRVRRGGGDRTETLVLLSKPPSLYLSPTLLSPLFFFLIVTHFFGARRFFVLLLLMRLCSSGPTG